MTSIFYATAAPELLENARTPALDDVRSQRFLQDMDDVFYALNNASQGAFSKTIRATYANRETQPSPYEILSSGRERTLGPAGLERLRALLKSGRLWFEMYKGQPPPFGKSRRLSPAEWLFTNFQDDITWPTARLLAKQYYVTHTALERAGRRTTFVAIGNVFAFIFGALVLAYPFLIVDVWHRLLAGNFTWALFAGPSETTHQFYGYVLDAMLGSFVIGFFISISKSISEQLAGNSYWVPYLALRWRGSFQKREQEFERLVDRRHNSEAWLDAYSKLSVQNDEDLREPLTAFARTVIRSAEAALIKAPRDIQRRTVAALYLYQQNPLHPKTGFFNDMPPLNLPTDVDLLTLLRAKARFQKSELNWLFEEAQAPLRASLAEDLGRPKVTREMLEQLTPEQLQIALDSLRRHGFPFKEGTPFKEYDNKRRDAMEELRVKLAIGKMIDAPVFSLFALISRDLTGIAFHPEVLGNTETADQLRLTLEDTIDRLRTLSRDVYVSYRKYSRYTKMGWQFYDAMEAVRHPDLERMRALEDQFSTVLSDREIDVTSPPVQELFVALGWMTPAEQARARLATRALFLSPLSRIAPFVALLLKRRIGLVRVVDDPEEKLALALLLKNPKTQTEKIPKAVAALRDILSVQLRAARAIGTNREPRRRGSDGSFPRVFRLPQTLRTQRH